MPKAIFAALKLMNVFCCHVSTPYLNSYAASEQNSKRSPQELVSANTHRKTGQSCLWSIFKQIYKFNKLELADKQVFHKLDSKTRAFLSVTVTSNHLSCAFLSQCFMIKTVKYIFISINQKKYHRGKNTFDSRKNCLEEKVHATDIA